MADRATMSDKQIYQKLSSYCARHLVCLSGTYRWLDERGKETGTIRSFAYSGFVMSFGGHWFLMTAGHVLKNLDDAIEAKKISIQFAAIQDHFGIGATTNYPCPISYEESGRLHVDNQNLGLDIGLVHLRRFYAENLKANGILPITKHHWHRQDQVDFAAYGLFGFPEEMNRPEDDVDGIVPANAARPALLGVERTDTPHRELPPTPYPWFIGRVATTPIPVNSIVGMSGGPIFGLCGDPSGGTRYWIIALQSWWDPNSRTIYGCPLPVFGPLVEQELISISETFVEVGEDPDAWAVEQ